MKSSRLSAREMGVVASTDTGRLGTLSKNGWPHVVPVGYVYSKEVFYVPSQKDSVKTGNVRRVPRATLVVDNDRRECGVMFQCEAEVLPTEAAEKWKRYMREVKGWGNNRETAVIALRPLRRASWFLKG